MSIFSKVVAKKSSKAFKAFNSKLFLIKVIAVAVITSDESVCANVHLCVSYQCQTAE